MSKIQLLVVDDHPLVIDGIRQILAEVADVALMAGIHTADEALQFLQQSRPDVVILDISLPDMDGMELCKKMLDIHPGLPIIGLTTYQEVSFVTRMLRNGALGYLYKNSTSDELLSAIRTVHDGERYLAKEVNEKMLAKAMYGAAAATSFIPKLTRREKEVLQLIVAEHTTQEIADQLSLSVSTVETHRMHLISKLGARNTAGLVRNAIKFGLA